MRIVPAFGGKGMTWMKVEGGLLQSNIVQFFTPGEQKNLMKRFKAAEGDVLMMIADHSGDLVDGVLGRLRLHLAERLGLIPEDRFCPLWVTDFPLFELKDGELSSLHHPFTMPDRTDFDPADQKELLALHSRAYDLVVNGEELGGGSVRIHTMGVQRRIFQGLGLSQERAEAKFGFFLKALEYGTPPHAGIALGMDRVIAMILRTPSIREVMAFPKNRRAFCPLTHSPSPVDTSQLEELALITDVNGGLLEKGAGRFNQDRGAGHPAGPSQRISEKEVKHVARLARLKLGDAEARSYQQDLNAVLDHFATLQKLDTEAVRPMSHVLELENVWREDIPANSKETDPLLSNAPAREKDYFKVPRILEG
jgi:aspartyl-tRNA synthetase